MSFTLSEVVRWGRSYDEYVSMFSLSPADLKLKIISCGDGPASFNAVLTRKGGSVVSVDPVYQFSAKGIKSRIEASFAEVMEQTRKNREEFVWRHIKSIRELGDVRMGAMQKFLDDCETGKEEGRYRTESLPCLSFSDNQFDLALCSHLLFLYSDHFDLDFHINSVREMCRVAREVRIFPLLDLGAKKSRHLKPLAAKLEKDHYLIEIRRVPYEFQKGGNEMMILKSPGNGIHHRRGAAA